MGGGGYGLRGVLSLECRETVATSRFRRSILFDIVAGRRQGMSAAWTFRSWGQNRRGRDCHDVNRDWGDGRASTVYEML